MNSLNREIEDKLGTSAARLRLLDSVVDFIASAIVITDAIDTEHPIVYVNPAFENITGYSVDQAIGRHARFLVESDLQQDGLKEIRAALRERRSAHALVRSYKRDGSLFWNDLNIAPVRDAEGRVTHFVSVINDATQRKLQEEAIKRHAHFDALTNLPNRALLIDRVRQATASAESGEHLVGILMIGLNRFTLINDAYGHEVGDKLLIAFGNRMASLVEPKDTVSRYSGDTFVLVVPNVFTASELLDIVQRIQSGISMPFYIDNRDIMVRAGVGISLALRDGSDVHTLLSRAETAMHRTKNENAEGFQFYSHEMNRQAHEKLRLEFDLRRALVRNEFFMHYQPIVDLNTGKVSAVEALLRWNDPNRGTVSPEDFIPIAEETGLIIPIGHWVLRQVTQQAAEWKKQGHPHVPISVNLSALQFRDPEIVTRITSSLAATEVEGSQLILEVTETVLMSQIEVAANILQRLKSAGVRIALDDFGTGYSSLSYLQQLPIDILKIDRSFIRNIVENASDAAIANTIITMAKTLEMEVVAEGVENSQQLHQLYGLGCDKFQGYLFCRPVPPDEISTVLEKQEKLDDGLTLVHVFKQTKRRTR